MEVIARMNYASGEIQILICRPGDPLSGLLFKAGSHPIHRRILTGTEWIHWLWASGWKS
ncbi:MAG: hypothetical protein Q8Q80_08395 [Methyloversatilis sp.]|uniref:hypothetical protein n=1 Tax=Methyloversatilis sp. TaxID=2569862 RepID=UPI00273271AE|nr:hypothetical protein [Methyloversatilis sp.]MDP3872668.1 hypothetical protein [Methyloversatilis sp.]